MHNILSTTTRQLVRNRIGSLDASMKPRWGRMNATAMLSHCAAQLRMSLGEITCRPRKSIFGRAPIKQMLVYLAPWPKSAPTAPELIRAEVETWEAEKTQLLDLIEHFAERIRTSSAPHPIFGKLSIRAWGRLAYRHLDHHLRQFGV
ncbi:MAG: DinB family protein [bacterium]|nr:DinB family protein [bacterium]